MVLLNCKSFSLIVWRRRSSVLKTGKAKKWDSTSILCKDVRYVKKPRSIKFFVNALFKKFSAQIGTVPRLNNYRFDLALWWDAHYRTTQCMCVLYYVNSKKTFQYLSNFSNVNARLWCLEEILLKIIWHFGNALYYQIKFINNKLNTYLTERDNSASW